jgi:membrane protein DedA with SNARE-associated domain
MPFGRYNLMTLLGNTVWCAAIAGVGWGLGSGYERFNHGFKYVEYAFVLLLFALLAYAIVRWRRATISD